GGVWLGTMLADAAGDVRRDPAPAMAGLLVALTALVLGAAPEFLEFGGGRGAALLVVAMIAVAAWRSGAIALLHAAGIATLLIQAQGLLGAAVEIDLWDFGIGVDAVWTSPEADAFLPYGA